MEGSNSCRRQQDWRWNTFRENDDHTAAIDKRFVGKLAPVSWMIGKTKLNNSEFEWLVNLTRKKVAFFSSVIFLPLMCQKELRDCWKYKFCIWESFAFQTWNRSPDHRHNSAEAASSSARSFGATTSGRTTISRTTGPLSVPWLRQRFLWRRFDLVEMKYLDDLRVEWWRPKTTICWNLSKLTQIFTTNFSWKICLGDSQVVRFSLSRLTRFNSLSVGLLQFASDWLALNF